MDANSPTKTVRANGADLVYVEQGSGPVVVFVHGSQGDYRTWLPLLRYFSPNYRTIAYSRRYHYPNTWTGDGRDYTVSLHADDLIALLEALDVAPAFVVGNSFGAYTTLLAATRRPELLRKIVIGEPPILPWLLEIPGGKGDYDNFLDHAWMPATRAFEQGDAESGLRLFVDGVSGVGTYAGLPAAARQRFLDNAPELRAETMSPGYFTPITTPAQVAAIRVPMLLLRGQNSPKMFHRIMDRLEQAVPRAPHATIPNASHAIYAGNPQGYCEAVLAFLQGHSQVP